MAPVAAAPTNTGSKLQPPTRFCDASGVLLTASDHRELSNGNVAILETPGTRR